MMLILAIIVAILTVTGQIFWKLGVSGKIHSFNSLFTSLVSPLVIIGAVVYMVATIIWIFMLSKYQYHHIYPLLSLTFVFGLFASRFILHEEVLWISWLGVMIICFGIILIGFGAK